MGWRYTEEHSTIVGPVSYHTQFPLLHTSISAWLSLSPDSDDVIDDNV